MTTKEGLFAALTASGVPWCNETWAPGKPPGLPYAVAVADRMSATHADNATTGRVTRYRVELYSRGRGYETERTVTDALDAAGICWGVQASGVVEADVCRVCLTATVMGD